MNILILVLLISFATISGLLFTPSLPAIATDFNVPDSVGQWAMTVFLIGYTLAQIPYGPLANRLGRKKAIYIGVSIALVGSLICYFSTTFEMLLVGRFIQAIGSAVGLKVTFTMIGDQYHGHAATKMLSYVALAFAIMPGLGVALGGYLTADYGWRGCFAFLSGYSVLIGLLAITLPETAKKLDHDALKVSKIGHALAKQFKDPFLVWHALLMGSGSSFIYIFSTVAPYLAISQLGLSPEHYGLWNIVPSIGMTIGLLSSAHFSHRLPKRIAMLSGILCAFLGVIIMGALFTRGHNVPAVLFIPTAIIMFGFSITYSAASSTILSEASDKSNASAVMSFINMGSAMALTFLAAVFLPYPPVILAAILGVVAIAGFAVWGKLKAHH